jgi:hypothetical protein
MISQETRKEIEKEEPFVLSTRPFANQSCLFAPDSPPTLTSNYSIRFQSDKNSLPRNVNFLMDSLNLHQTICSQLD